MQSYGCADSAKNRRADSAADTGRRKDIQICIHGKSDQGKADDVERLHGPKWN